PRKRRTRVRHPGPGVLDLDRPAVSRIGPFARAVLALPLVGSLALGLPLYVFPRPFARLAELSGDDTFIYELGGAAMIGYALALATLSAAVFGLGPQAPAPFAALMGYKGTDEYVYRLAGAACFGYAVTGIQELRSLHWDDMRLPNVMAIVFNGLAFLASAFEI